MEAGYDVSKKSFAESYAQATFKNLKTQKLK